MTKVSTPPEVEIRARELLPCPFCGADDNSGVAPSHDDEDYDGPIFWSVGCGCTAFVGPWSTEEEAIKCWNTRPALTPQDDVVEKMARAIAAKRNARRVRDDMDDIGVMPSDFEDARACLEAIRVGGGM